MEAQSRPNLHIDARLDPDRLRPVFKRFGRMHVPGVFEAESAQRIADALAETSAWQRTFNEGPGHYDVPVPQFDALPEPQRRMVTSMAFRGAREGFQYVYDSIRISNAVREGASAGLVLDEVFAVLNSEAFLGFVRRLTGDDRAVYCDAQATRYLPGHFLTSHDDSIEGKDRLYAYVLGFTPRWRGDWGGLLLFYDEDGHVAEGYTPAFNTLNIFRVPQQHAVSLVAPFAAAPRLSITGWVRSRAPGAS